jgi:4a-hydroxytetrahydrobiopterin dehydratase
MTPNCTDHGACPSSALSPEQARSAYALINPNWVLDFSGPVAKITRDFIFGTYKEALDFTNKVALIADAENHHPEITLTFKKVRVEYWTHNARGLTHMDFSAAQKIDKL